METFYNLLKKSRGFSLLEVLIAVFVLVVGIVGAYSVFGNMLAISSLTKEKLTAAYLAQEGIEIVRNIRDTNWINNPENSPQDGWLETVAEFTSTVGGENCQTSNGGCEADYKTGTASEGSNDSLQVMGTGRFLYLDLKNNSYTYDYENTAGNSPSIFKRQIVVNPMTINGATPPDPSSTAILDVVSTVYWQDRGVNYNFPVEEFLYNWNE